MSTQHYDRKEIKAEKKADWEEYEGWGVGRKIEKSIGVARFGPVLERERDLKVRKKLARADSSEKPR